MPLSADCRIVATLALALVSAPLTEAAVRRSRPHSSHHSSLSMRRRLHVNPLITDIGTVEVEWNSLYSGSAGDYSMPATLKYTPEGSSIWWGRTEYSVSFDTVEAYNTGGRQAVHFSDRVSLAATALLVDQTYFDLAVAPQVTSFLRGDSGVRAGATLIGRFDVGLNNLGFTAGWNGANVASATNPAGTMDLGVGAGRRLASHGRLGRITPHANFVYERSTGQSPIRAAFEGVEYQISPSVALDVSGQHFRSTNVVEHQFLVGLTVNLGRWR